MPKIQIPRKIRTEDYPADQQELVSKIGDIYNSFVDEVANVINGNINYDNLNREVKTLVVTMDPSGLVLNKPQIKTDLKTRIVALTVLNATNVTNPSVYPAGAPFVSWTINGNILTILNITGLQANSRYQLTLEIIG